MPGKWKPVEMEGCELCPIHPTCLHSSEGSHGQIISICLHIGCLRRLLKD
ncbi:Hypothetical predicted protein [Podarcis lilfordi]|uniref:Uncharacterized protein n=1 Tax=Podarcis lilfordi TaxID=74358 RepID=A0AA35PJM7_9SAUR|nr:Hypothetical predicted protein [Podarcis lilfordi]